MYEKCFCKLTYGEFSQNCVEKESDLRTVSSNQADLAVLATKPQMWLLLEGFINTLRKNLKLPVTIFYSTDYEATGTACIVKGSYCNCHYCKCEKGQVHCGYGKHGYGELKS